MNRNAIALIFYLALFQSLGLAQMARRADGGYRSPKVQPRSTGGEYLDLNHQRTNTRTQSTSSNNNTPQFRNVQVGATNSGLTQLWNLLNTIDQNLNVLLKNPTDDALFEQTKSMLLQALSLHSNVVRSALDQNEFSKLESFVFELNRKAAEVDRLRGLKQTGVSNISTGSSTLQVEQFGSGISDAFSQNSEKNKELNQQLDKLNESKSNEESQVKKKQNDVFGKLLEQEKMITQGQKNFNPKPGLGFTRILFQDENVELRYRLTLKIRKTNCSYKHVPFTTVGLDGKVKYHEEYVPFAAYYYEASYEIVNKKRQRLRIRGSILGSPGPFAQEHILPIGEIAECLGIANNDSYWHKFYYAWDLVLTEPSLSAVNHFWTEIADEEPLWTFQYSILK